MRLYNSFVMSDFTYCSVIWHNCLESGKQRALMCVYNKRVTPSPRWRWLELNFLYSSPTGHCHVNFSVNGMLSGYLSDLFVIRNNVKCLRGTNKLVVPLKSTTNFGLKSTTFIGAKVWNSSEYCKRARFVMYSFLWFTVIILRLRSVYWLLLRSEQAAT